MQGLAEGADVIFEVELVSFDKQPYMGERPAAECIEQARVLKDQGNVVFKKVRVQGSHVPDQSMCRGNT